MINPAKDLGAELEYRRKRLAMDAETKHDPSNGQFTGSGGSSSGGHKLPSKPGGSHVFDDGKGNSVKVSKKADGSYYADTGDYDFDAPDEASMSAKLKKNGYIKTEPAGYEHK